MRLMVMMYDHVDDYDIAVACRGNERRWQKEDDDGDYGR